MPRPHWNGRRVTNAKAWVINRDKGICWLCHHPGANSLDHILPASTHPNLEWTRTNWKAAHLGQAGQHDGCSVEGCTCPGNRKRGARPHTAPPTRSW
jgi:hypothetical protein